MQEFLDGHRRYFYRPGTLVVLPHGDAILSFIYSVVPEKNRISGNTDYFRPDQMILRIMLGT